MINYSLQKAIDSLQIKDVYQRDLIARCVGDFDPKYGTDLSVLSIQTKHWVKQSTVVELDGGDRLLRVSVDLGVRWVDESESIDNISIKALIEAEFIAEYSMDSDLEQECIDEFSLKNVSYHVWPYWRELLTSQCGRMNLPRVVLPVMQLAGNRHQPKE